MANRKPTKYAKSLQDLPDNFLRCREFRFHDWDIVDDLHVLATSEGPMLIERNLKCRRCTQPGVDTFRVARVARHEFLVRVGTRKIGYKPGYLLRREEFENRDGLSSADLIKAEAWRRAKMRLGLDQT